MIEHLGIRARLGAGFGVMLLLPLGIAVAGATRLATLDLLLALGTISTLAGIAIALWLTRTITRSIVEIAGAARKMADGDFNFDLKSESRDAFGDAARALSLVQRGLLALIGDTNNMSSEHAKGDIDVKIDADKFHGAYKSAAEAVNSMVFGQIALEKKAMACIREFGAGNMDAPLEQFPGKKRFINDAIEPVRRNVKALITETALLSQAAIGGKLDVRADASQHCGDFRKIVQDVNAALDAVAGGRSAVQVAQELRKVGSYNDVVRKQLHTVVGETEKAAFDIASRLQTIDSVVANLNTLVDTTTLESNQLLAKTEARIQESGLLIATLDQHIKERTTAVQTERQSVAQMAEAARSLGGLVELIRSISLQTKLLALNAAIEAAHAGTVGRGFAVVAAEVRKLATATESAVSQLNDGIQAVAQSIESHFRNKMDHDHIGAEQQALLGVALQVNVLGQSCQEVTDHESQVLVQIGSCSQQLSTMFIDALSSVQFQDVTRQQIEHVIGALTQLDSHAAVLAGKLEAFQDPQVEFKSITEHLEHMYGNYVMSSQRESHESALGGAVAKRAVGAPLPAIELF